MIKISFSGFSGSGKTSLLAEVKKILSLKYKVEAIDEIKGKNPFESDHRSFIGQFFLMSTQINEENMKAMTGPEYLLCDQSVTDQWVNWKSYIADKEISPQLEEKHKLFLDIYRFWKKSYDIIFWIRMDLQELEKREFNNEIRIADFDHIKKIDELYKSTIETDHLNVIEIWNNKTIDESAHEIIKAIAQFKEMEDQKEIHQESQEEA